MWLGLRIDLNGKCRTKAFEFPPLERVIKIVIFIYSQKMENIRHMSQSPSSVPLYQEKKSYKQPHGTRTLSSIVAVMCHTPPGGKEGWRRI